MKKYIFLSIMVLFIVIALISATITISERDPGMLIVALLFALGAAAVQVIADHFSVRKEIQRYNKLKNKHVEL